MGWRGIVSYKGSFSVSSSFEVWRVNFDLLEVFSISTKDFSFSGISS